MPALLKSQLHVEPLVLQARAAVRGCPGGRGPPRCAAVHERVRGPRLLIAAGLRVLPQRAGHRRGAACG